MRIVKILFALLFGFTLCKGQSNNGKYDSIKEQAATLTSYYDSVMKSTGTQRAKYEMLFFKAFPSSFHRMEELFGYDEKNGVAAILYDSGENIINLFDSLRYINKTLYYNKYIDICIGGKWEADNIQGGFDMYNKLYYDAKRVLNILSKCNESEIRSVFHFVLDGPIPDKESYNALYVRLQKVNPYMAGLMREEFDKLLQEHNEH